MVPPPPTSPSWRSLRARPREGTGNVNVTAPGSRASYGLPTTERRPLVPRLPTDWRIASWKLVHESLSCWTMTILPGDVARGLRAREIAAKRMNCEVGCPHSRAAAVTSAKSCGLNPTDTTAREPRGDRWRSACSKSHSPSAWTSSRSRSDISFSSLCKAHTTDRPCQVGALGFGMPVMASGAHRRPPDIVVVECPASRSPTTCFPRRLPRSPDTPFFGTTLALPCPSGSIIPGTRPGSGRRTCRRSTRG